MRTASLGASIACFLAACGTSNPPADTGTDASDATDTAPPDAMDAATIDHADVAADVAPDLLMAPDIARTQNESMLAPRRQSCTFDAGAWPAETLGTEDPIGTSIPIDHVFLLVMENRSFDEYFSQLPLRGQTDVEVPPANWSMTDSSGNTLTPTHDTTYCVDDIDHSWDGQHLSWDNGLNDGFGRNAGTTLPARTLYFEDQSDIPFYYGLANTFAIADHYFCGLIGPTLPNRLYLMAGTSFGLTDNTLVDADTSTTPVNHIFAELDRAGLEWRDYADGLRTISTFRYYGLYRTASLAQFFTTEQLISDLASGNVPPFSFIEPHYGGTGGSRADEHPPGMPMQGEVFVESIVRALMASPVWSRSALFITYDENGGFADHVPPPTACVPDGHLPMRNDGTPIAGGQFDHSGFRVPFIVVSPYAKAHYVSHVPLDPGSVLRFIEARFGLPAMTARDANATPPYDMFDFANPPFMTPPSNVPMSTLNQADVDRCNAAYPNATGL